jgi:hypothetical protein
VRPTSDGLVETDRGWGEWHVWQSWWPFGMRWRYGATFTPRVRWDRGGEPVRIKGRALTVAAGIEACRTWLRSREVAGA